MHDYIVLSTFVKTLFKDLIPEIIKVKVTEKIEKLFFHGFDFNNLRNKIFK